MSHPIGKLHLYVDNYPDIDICNSNSYICTMCHGYLPHDQVLDIARRISALWNAAEELGLTTEAIEKGVMQMAFAHSHEQGWVIEVALARIKKLEAEKAESEHALGFAVEAVERLEAEKAAVLAALEYAIKQVPELASVPGIKAAIKKESSES